VHGRARCVPDHANGGGVWRSLACTGLGRLIGAAPVLAGLDGPDKLYAGSAGLAILNSDGVPLVQQLHEVGVQSLEPPPVHLAMVSDMTHAWLSRIWHQAAHPWLPMPRRRPEPASRARHSLTAPPHQAPRRCEPPGAVLPPSRIGIAAESAARKHAPATTVRPYWYGPLPWA
jgi:hypothetical protein